jgi:hypothetical protein
VRPWAAFPSLERKACARRKTIGERNQRSKHLSTLVCVLAAHDRQTAFVDLIIPVPKGGCGEKQPDSRTFWELITWHAKTLLAYCDAG